MTIENVTVAGAGVMGRGIAYVSALAGFRTVLVDISEEQLQNALYHVRKTAEKESKREITEDEADNLLNNLTTTTTLELAVESCDLLIEAVPEKRELKKTIMETADAHAPSHAVLASNTSTISPTELASYTNRAFQVAVMHFSIRFIECRLSRL